MFGEFSEFENVRRKSPRVCWGKFSGVNFLRIKYLENFQRIFRVGVRMQDCMPLPAAIMICPTRVNTQTHTDGQKKTAVHRGHILLAQPDQLQHAATSVNVRRCPRRVRRRSRRTFSTHFEIFRRRFDGVVIYFFCRFRLQISRRRVGIFSHFFICCCFLFKVHVSFSSSQVSIGTGAIARSSTVLLL